MFTHSIFKHVQSENMKIDRIPPKSTKGGKQPQAECQIGLNDISVYYNKPFQSTSRDVKPIQSSQIEIAQKDMAMLRDWCIKKRKIESTFREISSAAFWRSERIDNGENPQPPPQPPPPPPPLVAALASTLGSASSPASASFVFGCLLSSIFTQNTARTSTVFHKRAPSPTRSDLREVSMSRKRLWTSDRDLWSRRVLEGIVPDTATFWPEARPVL